METLGYKLELTESAKSFIATKGYDVQFGARPLKRAIQKYLEDDISELIIKSALKEGDTIKVGFDEENQKTVSEVLKNELAEVVA